MDERARIEEAAEAMVAAREFCGGEYRAFLDWCFENDVEPSDEFRFAALERASDLWEQSQRAAGVRGY